MNRQPDDFDGLIEQSLHTYANAEPRHDLEQRILNRIRVATPIPAQARSFRQYWGWLATAAAASALAAILIYPHSRTGIVNLSQNSLSPAPNSLSPVPTTPIVSNTSTPIRARHRISPRRPVPTAPAVALLEPTTQEKLLAQFVSTHRSEALNVAKAQAALDQPIAVRPLEVQPIKLQPISSEPIVIGRIQIDDLQPGRPHPASF